jgi:hypothetical protein
MRIPESFGLLPYMKHDHVYLLALFSACRLITEHIFAMQCMPQDNQSVNKFFNIPLINEFIKETVYTSNPKIPNFLQS